MSMLEYDTGIFENLAVILGDEVGIVDTRLGVAGESGCPGDQEANLSSLPRVS